MSFHRAWARRKGRYRCLVPFLAAFGTWVAANAQNVPNPAQDTTGWTSSSGPLTPADSLPVFRPDSLRDGAIRAAESAPSPFARRRTTRDSADSVAALLRGRRPGISVHLGLNFLDLDAKDVFNTSLQARLLRDSLAALQPYEPVHIAIPAGIQAMLPVGPHFDLMAKTHSYWYRQTAVLGRGGSAAGEEFYAVQAHLGGAGLRYYIPPDLLSVSGQLGIYVQGIYYWLLGGGEIYTNHGSAPARFDPQGSAFEIQAGFSRAISRPIQLSGSLGYIQQDYASDREWSSLVASNPPPGKVRWSAGAIQASFSLWYHFGVPSRSAVPAGQASPQGTPAPAGQGPSAPAPGPR
jgi:hypothetical protein